jgi:hypothetical protein
MQRRPFRWAIRLLTLINTRSGFGGQSVSNSRAPLWKFTQLPFQMVRQCHSSTRVTAKIFHHPSTGQTHRQQRVASYSSATIPMHLGEPGIIGRSMICQIENGPLRKVHPAIQNLSSKRFSEKRVRGPLSTPRARSTSLSFPTACTFSRAIARAQKSDLRRRGTRSP